MFSDDTLELFFDDEDGFLEWMVFGDYEEEQRTKKRGLEIAALAAAGYYYVACCEASKRARQGSDFCSEQLVRNKNKNALVKQGDASSVEKRPGVGQKRNQEKVPEFVTIPSTACEKQSAMEKPCRIASKSTARKTMKANK